MKRILILLCAATALPLVLSLTLVHAQEPPQRELENPKLDAKACADRERLPFGDAAHLLEKEATTGVGSGDRLGRNDAVICPPQDLDPNIHAPAPGGGRTPIVPPSAVEPPGTQAK
jgi:hypothetical protein